MFVVMGMFSCNESFGSFLVSCNYIFLPIKEFDAIYFSLRFIVIVIFYIQNHISTNIKTNWRMSLINFALKF